MQETEVKALGKPEEEDIRPDDVEAILQAKLPLVNNPRKASYLSYRATGFKVREACHLAEVNLHTVLRWRREDPDFAAWEGKSLGFLQQKMGDDILRAEFMRNMKLALRRDFKVLYRSVYNLEGLSDREFEYLKLVRRHYTPSDLLALERALAPDVQSEGAGGVHVTVNVGAEQIESEAANRAAAKELLDRFSANGRLAIPDVETIEGELVGTGDSD